MSGAAVVRTHQNELVRVLNLPLRRERLDHLAACFDIPLDSVRRRTVIYRGERTLMFHIHSNLRIEKLQSPK